MWELVANEVAENGGVLMQNNKVTRIDVDSDSNIKSVLVVDTKTGEEKTIACDYLFYTTPVKHLISSLQFEVPKDVLRG